MLDKLSRILVVDDMKTMRMVVKKALKELGFENVDEADDGESALPKLVDAVNGGQPFKLVLSDWNMPKMQGIDLLRQVRRHPKLKDLAFFLVTAESEKEQVIEALKEGVSGYLMKPFTSQALSEKINALQAKLSKAS